MAAATIAPSSTEAAVEGLISFLFTDIVGSTRLWAREPESMAADLAEHDAIVRGAIEEHDGRVFATGGDGFAAAFSRPSSAVAAASSAQRALSSATWRVAEGVQVRMGIHVGEAIERNGDFFGPTLNLAARLMSAAHGGQIVVTDRVLEPSMMVVDLGVHRLRDVPGEVRVFQIVEDGLREGFEPLRTLDRFRSTLPSQRSSFVGRREEIDRVRQMLAADRLVTLTGIGGAGKTRLAVEVAAEEQPAFGGGVFFVDLAPVVDPAEVHAAFLSGIGLVPVSTTSPEEELERFLGAREVLLVVDNCEHLLDATAAVIETVLDCSGGTRVLATSREPLGLLGEMSFRVPPLEAERAALRLFVDRATSVNDAFELDDHARATIADLCRHLDGLPLAVELAAARAATMTPAEINAELQDRFALLRSGRRRGVVSRQRALDASLDWSYDLLEPDEKQLFRRLSAFAGPFLFEVIPFVGGFDRNRTRDLLDSLVAKSLVAVQPIDRSHTAYRLLESVRAYAARRLGDAGEANDVVDAHAEAYLALCDRPRSRRQELGFLRAQKLQIEDIWAAADHLVALHRLDDAVCVLDSVLSAVIGSSYFGLTTARIEELWTRHAQQLRAESRAVVGGAVARAQMYGGRQEEWVLTALEEYVGSRGVPFEARSDLEGLIALMEALTAPNDLLARWDELAAEIRASGDPEFLSLLETYHGLASATQRSYRDALDVLQAVQERVPTISTTYRASLVLWLCHFTGEPAPQESLAVAGEILDDDPGVLIGLHVAAVLATADDVDEAGRQLVPVCERLLDGRLRGEASEPLVAFARIAQLAGDHDRAMTLVGASAGRTPWGIIAMHEIIGSVEGWPSTEWVQRGLEADQRMWADLDTRLEVMDEVLANELDLWR